VILGLCAALEIPLMLGFGVLSVRVPVRRLILFGAACGALYSALAVAAPAIWVLAVAQIANAVFIAATSGLGFSYVQDLMPAHPGRASTMFANTFPVGQMLSAPLFGLAQHFGYRLAYGMDLVLCLLGLILLAVVRPRSTGSIGRGGRLRLGRARTGGTDAAAGDRRPA
jgi:SET family sugar efflux transporter-like MFS transporter